MVDSGTGLSVLAASPLMLKLLGPTADYVGRGLKSWTEHRIENVKRIFAIAEQRLDGVTLSEGDSVPPRVLKKILDEGSFVDDEVVAEYFAGVLVGSRTEDRVDDRGAAILEQIAGLSNYQIRSHYVFYETARELLQGKTLNLADVRVCKTQTATYISARSYIDAMGLTSDTDTILRHSLHGLVRDGLLHHEYATGSPEYIQKLEGIPVEEVGLTYRLTGYGVELFCWAHGIKSDFLQTYLSGSNDVFKAEASLRSAKNAKLLVDLQE